MKRTLTRARLTPSNAADGTGAVLLTAPPGHELLRIRARADWRVRLVEAHTVVGSGSAVGFDYEVPDRSAFAVYRDDCAVFALVRGENVVLADALDDAMIADGTVYEPPFRVGSNDGDQTATVYVAFRADGLAVAALDDTFAELCVVIEALWK